jgi:hypothetical protein
MTTAPSTPVYVHAYAGANYPGHPISIIWQGKRLDVLSVERSWRTPDALHYRVQLESLGLIELIYHFQGYTWSMIPSESSLSEKQPV